MKTNNFTPEIKQAITDIVAYNTLPPQIDYAKPWMIKANKAETFIETLSNKKEVQKQIRKEIDAYYAPDEKGNSAAYYDSLF